MKLAENGAKKDFWKPVVIKQGYVPKDCTLNGGVVWALINQSEDPCDGCNEQRSVCHGRPRRPDTHRHSEQDIISRKVW